MTINATTKQLQALAQISAEGIQFRPLTAKLEEIAALEILTADEYEELRRDVDTQIREAMHVLDLCAADHGFACGTARGTFTLLFDASKKAVGFATPPLDMSHAAALGKVRDDVRRGSITLPDRFYWTAVFPDEGVVRSQVRVTGDLLGYPGPDAAVGGLDPRDGDGWTDAVARDGVRVPSYRDGYLSSTHWELLKAERLTGRCDWCHRERGTLLHHTSYRHFGHERPEDTIEVCYDCHDRLHAIPRAA
jgi:hypothetical protein